MDRVLFRGNHAIGEAAVRAGCRYYFGYPITPQNELCEYMASRLLEVGGVFVQGESETASVCMVMGASMAGARVMTSSSGPGISLKQEGISFLAAMELPCVIVNMMRGGPGMGNIAPSQSDYFQATRGGGHGDYRTIVYGPSSVQEAVDLTYKAFDMADEWRNPVVVLGDGMIGQMMEPVVFPPFKEEFPEKDWVLDGAEGREKRDLNSLLLDPNELEAHNLKLRDKYRRMEKEIVEWEEYLLEDAEIVLVSYGTASRIGRGAVNNLRKEGIKIGLFRPITLWPFPKDQLYEKAKGKKIVVFELSAGQLVEDVELSVGRWEEIHLYGRPGGVIPTPRDVEEFVRGIL